MVIALLMTFLRRTPRWWEWEVELTPHAEARMDERGCSELDLRTIWNTPRSYGRTMSKAGTSSRRGSEPSLGASSWSRMRWTGALSS
jgi:hypothetical protein